MDRLSSAVQFTGILELKGKDLNKYFRDMETVTHDKWEPERHANPKQARAFIKEIKEWIKESIYGLAEGGGDEVNVKLGGVLSAQKPDKPSDDAEKQPTVDVDSVFTRISSERGPDSDGVRALSRRRRSRVSTDTEPVFIEDKDGRDDRQSAEKEAAVHSLRIIKQGAGKYSVIFNSARSFANGRVQLDAVGENGAKSTVEPVGVTADSGCTSAELVNGSVNISGVKAANRVRLTVTFADTRDYAMGVRLYEYIG